jgi:Protein of Unknown function (DUF2784)
MSFRVLADAVVVVHLGFILFVVLGPLLARCWPLLLRVHLPALAWAAVSVTVGAPCPLTPLENGLRRLAGEGGYAGGFVDHYLEDVVYPGEHTTALRVLAVIVIAAGYGWLGALTVAHRAGRSGTRDHDRVVHQ